ncbi:HAD family hydrolase [Paenibacillus cymbidii]|uniref:HAD family hydrolase n=1 Tax=Paenibacillus cymbidii TaxID=1639034 RepID=UPI001080F946|nr:HAD-IA family hydrolase [Paenibacillus cymbidii]
MTSRAVVFDLWNTLVPLPDWLKDYAFRETTTILQTDPLLLKEAWSQTRTSRETMNLFTYLKWLRSYLDAKWSDEEMTAFIRLRKAIHGTAFCNPDEETVNVLKSIKSMGIPTALVSNCSSDVREMISNSFLESLIDCKVLSAETGIMKPDEQIFRLAANRLGVEPAECLYVGDGHDNELEGATGAGMKAMMLDKYSGKRWNGNCVSSLSEAWKEISQNWIREEYR